MYGPPIVPEFHHPKPFYSSTNSFIIVRPHQVVQQKSVHLITWRTPSYLQRLEPTAGDCELRYVKEGGQHIPPSMLHCEADGWFLSHVARRCLTRTTCQLSYVRVKLGAEWPNWRGKFVLVQQVCSFVSAILKMFYTSFVLQFCTLPFDQRHGQKQ